MTTVQVAQPNLLFQEDKRNLQAPMLLDSAYHKPLFRKYFYFSRKWKFHLYVRCTAQCCDIKYDFTIRFYFV